MSRRSSWLIEDQSKSFLAGDDAVGQRLSETYQAKTEIIRSRGRERTTHRAAEISTTRVQCFVFLKFCLDCVRPYDELLLGKRKGCTSPTRENESRLPRKRWWGLRS